MQNRTPADYLLCIEISLALSKSQLNYCYQASPKSFEKLWKSQKIIPMIVSPVMEQTFSEY